MNEWIRVAIIFVIILIGDHFVYISAKKKVQAELGEKCVKEMRKELDAIRMFPGNTPESVRANIDTLLDWNRAFAIIKDICDI